MHTVTITFIFSGPATRAQADDLDQWADVKTGREVFAVGVKKSLMKEDYQQVKTNVYRDQLCVEFTSDRELLRGDIGWIVDHVIALDHAGELAPDDPEVRIKKVKVPKAQ